MDIQKEKDLYLKELLEREVISKDEFDDIEYIPEVNSFHSNYLSVRFIEKIDFGWSAWQAKAQAVPEWISMKDECPRAGESVLICINGIRQNIAYFYDYSARDEYSTGHDWFEPVFTGGETEDECVVKTEDVTHWMLLPQEPTND